MSADDYETEYMGGGDGVLFREKHVSRWFAGLMALPALVTLAAAGAVLFDPATPAIVALIPLAIGALVATAGVYFAVMRVTVSTETVRVQYGELGPSIDVAAITKHEVVELDALTRFAFGAKIWPEGWRYTPPGVREGVRISWMDGASEKTCTVGASDARGLAAAIAEARARSSATTGVRVEVEPEEVDEEVATAARRPRGREAGTDSGGRRRR